MQVEVCIEVENILNRIYLDNIGRKGQPPAIYAVLINSIESLPEKSVHIKASTVSNAPFAWKRDNLYVLRANEHYMFSYEILVDDETGEEICAIYEIAENGIILTESKLTYHQKRAIYESIMKKFSIMVKRALDEQL